MNIPGWNQRNILNVISEYSSKIPPGGNILELGALFGRTTFSIGHNKLPDVNLVTIDIWPDLCYAHHTETWFHDKRCGTEELALLEKYSESDKISGENFFELWKHFTKDIPNLVGIRDLTSMPTDNFPNFDLIIHDAAHDYDTVYADLCHWFPKLKTSGVMIIDDYEPNHFPDLVRAVNRFVQENKLVYRLVTERNILIKREE